MISEPVLFPGMSLHSNRRPGKGSMVEMRTRAYLRRDIAKEGRLYNPAGPSQQQQRRSSVGKDFSDLLHETGRYTQTGAFFAGEEG